MAFFSSILRVVQPWAPSILEYFNPKRNYVPVSSHCILLNRVVSENCWTTSYLYQLASAEHTCVKQTLNMVLSSWVWRHLCYTGLPLWQNPWVGKSLRLFVCVRCLAFWKTTEFFNYFLIFHLFGCLGPAYVIMGSLVARGLSNRIRGLSSCSVQAGCSLACGILVPLTEIAPTSLHCKVDL